MLAHRAPQARPRELAGARAILAPAVAAKLSAIAAMDQYFLDDRPVAEAHASTAWFEYAERNGIDLPRAISLWEDASTLEGEASRQAVAQAGIRVVVDQGRTGGA